MPNPKVLEALERGRRIRAANIAAKNAISGKKTTGGKKNTKKRSRDEDGEQSAAKRSFQGRPADADMTHQYAMNLSDDMEAESTSRKRKRSDDEGSDDGEPAPKKPRHMELDQSAIELPRIKSTRSDWKKFHKIEREMMAEGVLPEERVEYYKEIDAKRQAKAEKLEEEKRKRELKLFIQKERIQNRPVVEFMNDLKKMEHSSKLKAGKFVSIPKKLAPAAKDLPGGDLAILTHFQVRTRKGINKDDLDELARYHLIKGKFELSPALKEALKVKNVFATELFPNMGWYDAASKSKVAADRSNYLKKLRRFFKIASSYLVKRKERDMDKSSYQDVWYKIISIGPMLENYSWEKIENALRDFYYYIEDIVREQDY